MRTPPQGDGMPLLALDAIDYFITTLARPECILATASGTLFASDRRGGVAVIRPDGTHSLILARDPPPGFLPNGIALLRDGSFLIADVGGGGVWQLAQDGALKPRILAVDGRTLPATNFVAADDSGHVWATVSTWAGERTVSARRGIFDGFIVVQDARGTRIAADGLGFTNEAKIDPTRRFIYVNETVARRLSRFPIRPGFELGPRETVVQFGEGCFLDGMDFDAEGGIWVTCLVSNRIYRILPDTDDIRLILADTDDEHVRAVEQKYQAGDFPGWHSGSVTGLPAPASITFGGPDLRTAYIGFPLGERIARFASPVTGAKPVYWDY